MIRLQIRLSKIGHTSLIFGIGADPVKRWFTLGTKSRMYNSGEFGATPISKYPRNEDGSILLNLTLLHDLPNGKVYIDQFNEYWNVFSGPKKDCHFRCNIARDRPHLTCLHCRYRKWVKGELPDMIRLRRYCIFDWVDKPNARLKNIIRKPLLTLAEILCH